MIKKLRTKSLSAFTARELTLPANGKEFILATHKINEIIEEVNKYIPLREVKEFKANSSKEEVLKNFDEQAFFLFDRIKQANFNQEQKKILAELMAKDKDFLEKALQAQRTQIIEALEGMKGNYKSKYEEARFDASEFVLHYLGAQIEALDQAIKEVEKL